ncbi:MAG TPA: Rap1a/Tai family immunity protein [Alphaproteobacteria bacterium]|nr:Rap1a/Tai family immunity protein [Alphaproteobacteria bacterium]
MKSPKLAIFIFASLILVAGGHAHGAEFLTGKALLSLCEDKTPHGYNPGICIGYISGASDQLDGLKGSALPDLNYCLPSTASTGELREVVVNFLKQHPERLDQQASFLIFDALTRAYACAAH